MDFWTILKKETCLGIVSACRVDPVVPLHLRNTAAYRLPTFGPHGTKLGHSWLQWIMKSDFLAGLTILKKKTCLGIVSACRVDPVVSLHLRNTADHRFPIFGPHGTKLGHSWLKWIMKSDFLAGLTILKKVSGLFERLRGWSRVYTPPQECSRLSPTYFWTTWHQTRAFYCSEKWKLN